MFKIFEWISEALGWIQIVLSPLAIGLGLGAIIYFPDPTTVNLCIAVSIVLLGLVIGIIWASRIWRKRGTVQFLSRVSATPELDKKEMKNELAAHKNKTDRS